LAGSTSLTACLNAALLYRRLRRDKVFAPEPGWGAFVLQVGGALTVMVVLLVLFSGPLSLWLALDDLHRVARLTVVIVGAIAAYFAVLFALGLRYRHLFHRP
jgi:putative peptidoglycan lipid II flippase